MKVLITAGPCEEPLDGVRRITNFSSGKTGADIADYFSEHGDSVLYIHGERAVQPIKADIKRLSFRSFSDLEICLEETINSFKPDMIIHLAAVSDYSVDTISIGDTQYRAGELAKINSETVESFSLVMRRNPKIIDRLRTLSKGNAVIIGFKLTRGAGSTQRLAKVEALLGHASVDYVVSNDLDTIDAEKHHYQIFDSSAELVSSGMTKADMQKDLYNLRAKK